MGIGNLLFQTAIKAAKETGVLEKVSNTLGTKMNEITKTKEIDEILSDTTFKYKVPLEYETRGNYKWLYSIFDEKHNEEYRIKRALINSGKINLSDVNDTVIGYVYTPKLIIPSPFEKELQECEIVLNDKQICTIRRYYELGKEEVAINYNNWVLKKNFHNTLFEIFNGNTLICQINKPFAKATHKERYILLFDDKNYEEIFILITMAIQRIYFDTDI